MAVLSSWVSSSAVSLCGISNPRSTIKSLRKYSISISASSSSAHESKSTTKTENYGVSAKGPFVESPEFPYSYAPANPNGSPVVRFVQSTESTIEKVIFDFRFFALLAVGGSLAGSVLCFLNGCVYIFDAYRVYWTSCIKDAKTITFLKNISMEVSTTNNPVTMS